MTTPMTPREVARMRLVTGSHDAKVEEIYPDAPDAYGGLPKTYENAIAVAQEMERVALMLLALIGHSGGDYKEALQTAFVQLDQAEITGDDGLS